LEDFMGDFVKTLYPHLVTVFPDDLRAKALAAPTTNKPHPL
jgi:hypothetical protein